MIHEEKKVAKIVEELTMFFFSIGATEMESSIKREGSLDIIHFKSNYNPYYRSNLHYLEKDLNEPRNEGLEDIYWELAGSGEPGESSQLLLIGLMIDRAQIQIGESQVELRLFKEMRAE